MKWSGTAISTAPEQAARPGAAHSSSRYQRVKARANVIHSTTRPGKVFKHLFFYNIITCSTWGSRSELFKNKILKGLLVGDDI